MLCPFCKAQDSKVIDSRAINDGQQTRRRRECIQCSARFTSYEIIELSAPRIMKKDGNLVNFDAEKIRQGMLKALEKRPISTDKIESSIQTILKKAQTSSDRELATKQIGQWVLEELCALDEVAYLRFVSVYHQFTNATDFQAEITKLHTLKNQTVLHETYNN